MKAWIPENYESRYGLLGVMADELREALEEAGVSVNETKAPEAGDEGVFFFFNFISDVMNFPAEVRRVGTRVALVQIYVDHPYGLHAEMVDGLSKLSHYRLVMPCVDGWHLLRSRWPTLRHSHVLHAVGPGTLCEAGAGALAGREFDVVVAGSIHSEDEIAELEAFVPEGLRVLVHDSVELMEASPWTPFEQAMDIAMGSRNILAKVRGEWPLLSRLWRVASAIVNRRRRLRLVHELEGLNGVVFGGEAWRGECERLGLTYGGQAAYGDLPEALARGRVCVGWGPTQFAHSVSERGLLGMAAGCATVADDRLLARPWREAGAAELFDAGRHGSLRSVVDGLLASPARMGELSDAGRNFVERECLWSHRVPKLLEIGREAVGMGGDYAPSMAAMSAK